MDLKEVEAEERPPIAEVSQGQAVAADAKVLLTQALKTFNFSKQSAAHKHLPLPTNVEVTNLENGRSIIVRVNDRGPFPSTNNSRSGKRIID